MCNKECNHVLTDEQLTKIVDMTIEKLSARFYQEIGRSVTDKFFFVVGVATLALTAYLNTKGFIK